MLLEYAEKEKTTVNNYGYNITKQTVNGDETEATLLQTNQAIQTTLLP